jgi:hypothetical protein
MSRVHLLVTGPTRSGTTLAARLLDAHPAISVPSQPYPLLYPEVMADFLAACGEARPHLPLGDLFLEDRYRPHDLAGFLDSYRPGTARLEEIWDAMERYSGRQTAVPLARGPGAATSFATLLQSLLDAAAPGDALVSGAKEVMVEEFLPYLIDRGFRGVIVIRDPRDVVASVLAPGSETWVGRPRPLLFILRNWRRAVTVAAALSDHPGFRIQWFEEMTVEPESELESLAHWLGLDRPFDSGAAVATLDRIPANSSFEPTTGVSSAPAGRYHTELSDAVIRYIETVCGPEMDWLGYERADHHDVAALAAFTEPGPVRDDVDPGMSSDPGRLTEEHVRLCLAASGIATSDEQERYFRFPDAYRRLSSAYREGPA